MAGHEPTNNSTPPVQDAIQAVRDRLYKPSWWQSACSLSGYWVGHLMPEQQAAFRRQRIFRARVGGGIMLAFVLLALFHTSPLSLEPATTITQGLFIGNALSVPMLAILIGSTFLQEGGHWDDVFNRWGSLILIVPTAAAIAAFTLAYSSCTDLSDIEGSCDDLQHGVPRQTLVLGVVLPIIAPMILQSSWQVGLASSCILMLCAVIVTARAPFAFMEFYLFELLQLLTWTAAGSFMWRQWQHHVDSIYIASAAVKEASLALREERMERMRAQALRQAHASTISFASHELRNPLHAAMANYEAAMARVATHEAQQHADAPSCQLQAPLHEMGPQLAQMSGLLNDILVLDALVEETLEASTGPVDIRGLVQDVVSQFKAYSLVPLTCRAAASLPACIKTDARHVKQLLTSGIIMAVGATPSGSVTVEVQATQGKDVWSGKQRKSVTPRSSYGSRLSSSSSMPFQSGDASHATQPASDDQGSYLQIRVVDTGTHPEPGVQTPSLAGRHRSLHSTRGSGITLHVCEKLAALLGGTLWLETLSDGRVEFAFCVAMELCSEPSSSNSSSKQPQPQPQQQQQQQRRPVQFTTQPLPGVPPMTTPPSNAMRESAATAPVEAQAPLGVGSRHAGRFWQHGARGNYILAAPHVPPEDGRAGRLPPLMARSNVGSGAGAGAGAGAGVPAAVQHAAVVHDAAADADAAAHAAEDAGVAATTGSVVDVELGQGKPAAHAAAAPARPRAGRRRPRAGQPKAAALPSQPAPAHTFRVLWVDDVAMNRVIGKRMVEKLGHSCDMLEDGDEAVAGLLAPDADSGYDVVFLDIVMQRMNGDVAAKKLREAGCRLPLVAATGNASASDWEYYISECGFDAVLPKPFNTRAVEHVLAGLDEVAGNRGSS